jgi:oxygen-independent coproporphyrinogen-3 oxidase
MFQFTQLPPLALYIHFPWCVQKCPYCDFNSHKLDGVLEENRYIDALIQDLEQELPRIWGRTIHTIFMGGGTPSLFSPQSLDRLISAIRARLPLSADAEITMEANPGTIEAERFYEYFDIGINRLSIGIQSFHDDQLTALGRIHDRKQAIKAVETAHAAGFSNFNLDLMFSLPGQNRKSALEDVQTAIDLEPAHISYYQLTLEPNTLFYKFPPTLPDDDTAWDIQDAAQSILASAGYTQYEVSAYAKNNHRCRHNLNYWSFGDYLGIGAGAHDKISDAQQQSITRQWKQKHPQRYLETITTDERIAGSRTLGTSETVFEFMMNALRLCDGIETPLFSRHTGLPLILAEPGLRKAQQQQWLNWDSHYITPTRNGQQFLNDVLEVFLPHD